MTIREIEIRKSIINGYMKSSRRLRERIKKGLYINHKHVKEKLKAQKSLRNQVKLKFKVNKNSISFLY